MKKGGNLLKAAILAAVLAVMSVFTVTVQAAEGDTVYKIKIIQTSDIHAYAEEVKNGDGETVNLGMPKLKTLIADRTAGADGSLVLDSGDAFHGQSIATERAWPG